MLSKYIDFFKGKKKPAEHEQGRDSTSRSGGIVDTRKASGEVVTDLLDVSGGGGKTDLDQLVHRIVGRRTLYSAHFGVAGYELQLKGHSSGSTNNAPEVQRRYDIALLEGVRGFVDGRQSEARPIFFRVAPATLAWPELRKLPRGTVVPLLSMPKDVTMELVSLVEELIADGIPVGLDGVEIGPQGNPLLKHAKYLRFSVGRFDGIELGKQVVAALRQGSPQLMARGIDTAEDFEACAKLGFSIFDGRYFRSPPLREQRLDQDRSVVMDILNRVMNRAELSELEQCFKHDPMLSYKLLRYMNSAGSGVAQEVHSIGHALFILGYDQLYRWLTLLLFSGDKVDERTRGLLKAALIRARLAELLGYEKLPVGKREGLFICGIFSLLDQLLGVPMGQVVARLRLPAEVAEALAHRRGIYAPFLELAIACEDFDAGRIAKLAEACGCTANEVNVAHVQALLWAENVDR